MAARVVKVSIAPENSAVQTVWATGHVFDSPHSIAMHEKSQVGRPQRYHFNEGREGVRAPGSRKMQCAPSRANTPKWILID